MLRRLVGWRLRRLCQCRMCRQERRWRRWAREVKKDEERFRKLERPLSRRKEGNVSNKGEVLLATLLGAPKRPVPWWALAAVLAYCQYLN